MAGVTIKTVFAQECRSLGRIGRVGENLAREIVFDCSKVLEGNAGAQIVCAIHRPGDRTPYTRPMTADGAGRYTLTLTAADVEKAGSVRMELRMVDGEAVLKTAIYTGIVSESIGEASGPPAEPMQDMLNRLEGTIEAGNAATAAANTAASEATAIAEAARAAEADRAAAEEARASAEADRAAAEEERAAEFVGYANQIAAATPDDTIIGARPWTSKKTVDALCMPLEESGSVVTCHPVEGYPLSVKQSVTHIQHCDWMEKGATTTQTTSTGAQLLDISKAEVNPGKPFGLSVSIENDWVYIDGIADVESAEQYSFAIFFVGQPELQGKGYKIACFGSSNIIGIYGLRSEDESAVAVFANLSPGKAFSAAFQVMISAEEASAWEPYTAGQTAPSPAYPQPLENSLPEGAYYTPCTSPDGGYWGISPDAPLGGVEGYADAVEIDAYTGRYRIVRRTGVIVLDGTESWSIGGKYLEDGSDWYYQMDTGIADAPDANSVPLICDTYPMALVANNTVDEGVGILWQHVRVRWGAEGTIDDWKAQLAANPVTIRYALAQPTIATGQAEHSTSAVGTALNPTTMGLTVPDPEHPCEITGWDSVRLTRCGKNLLDPALCIESGVSNEVTLRRNADGSYTATGTPTGNISKYAFMVYIHEDMSRYVQGVTYYIVDNTYFKARIGYANGPDDYVRTFTFDRASMMSIRLYFQVAINDYVDGMTIYPGLYLEEDADWEPYGGDSYAVELPETVYGGTLDWETGVLTVTNKSSIVDTVVNRIAYGDAGYAMYYPLNMADIAAVDGSNGASSHFKTAYAWQQDDEYCYVSSRSIYFFTDRWDTLEDAQAWFAENKPRIVYELATPYTIQLTPRQVLALAGENNIYANSGDVEVRGRTDPVYLTHTLMERIAALEAAAINA